MRNFFIFTSCYFILSSCMKGESVDFVIHNANVHVMDDKNSVYEAIAFKDGEIVEVGPERQILNRYSANEYIDAQKRDVYPGFTDAHGHMMSYAKQELSVNLVGCRSYEEMLVRIEKYQSKNNTNFIVGRGWDQSLWKDQSMPSNKELSKLFPNTPVCLFRIDGHALLANEFLIKKSNVVEKFKSDAELNQGGYFILDTANVFTGIMVDNAMNPILEMIPDFSEKKLTEKILEIQSELYGYGITGVHEAGLENSELKLFEKLVNKGKLQLNIYGMLLPTEENIAFAKKNGIYTNKNLLIRSFKIYGDGALGSRGAFLKEVYSDHSDHHGYLTTSSNRMNEIAQLCMNLGYQMNSHAIGDSTNRILLELYQKTFETNPDHRWRIEHAQIIDPADFNLFASSGAFPSVQPTHAVSDQRWVESRIGKKRMIGAYAYQTLLNQFGMIAIGTDFPVELTDPFLTIHAAVQRKNIDNFPGLGFLTNEQITFEDCIKGMTIWAAFASFQENQLGTLEKGKDATLVIFDRPVKSEANFSPNFAHTTFIKGKKVYSVE